ncbi:MAG: M48 family metalloprotease [Candidatus Latescibacteria bacterium]|nr:M48 family metalloprotease [Candidatus Latescibacterota bacterium]
MVAIAEVMAHPLVQALGWTLIHFIWQGAIVGLLVAGGLGLLRHSGPGVRYAMAGGGLLVLLGLPVVTWWSLGEEAASTSLATSAGAAGEQGWSLVVAWLPVGEGGLVWAVVIWVAGVLLLSLWRTGGWAYTWYLRTRETSPVAPRWQACLVSLAHRSGVRRTVRLLESLRVGAPVVIGWLRPVILVPLGLFSGLSPGQVEAILAHELAHIRRHDYLVNVLQTVAETLLFYHPAVWWVSRQIRVEREYCCDDLAARLCGGGQVYAEALMALELWRGQTPQLAMAFAGGRLVDRIRRQVEQSAAEGGASAARWPGLVVAPVLVLLVMLVGGAERSHAVAPLPGAVLYYPIASKAENRRSVGPPLQVNGARRGPDRFGRPASAYVFDGSGEYDIELAGPVSGDFKTITFWARSEVPIRPGDPHVYCLMGENTGVAHNSGIGFGHFTSALDNEVITLAWAEGSSKAYYWTAATLPGGIDTGWHFYAFVWDEIEAAYLLYVDSERKGRPDLVLWNNHTRCPPPAGRAPTFIEGAQWHLGRYGTDHSSGWLGALDGVAIFSRSLSAAEIGSLYTAEGSVSEQVGGPGVLATAGTVTGAADTVAITNVGEVPLRLRLDAGGQADLSGAAFELAPREARAVAIRPLAGTAGVLPLRAEVEKRPSAAQATAEDEPESGTMFIFRIHSPGMKYSWVTVEGEGLQ